MVRCRKVFGVVAVVFLSVVASATHAQRAADDSPLVVDGTVRQVFRSAAPGRNESLLQIDVTRSEARGAAEAGSLSRFPAPGEPLYVHVSQEGRPGVPVGGNALPAEGTKVRAFLKPRAQGGWEGASAAWIQPLGEATARKEISPEDLAREAIEKSNRGASLGMTTELLKVDDRYVLRVTSVERGGPAQASGLEVGDVIAAADGKEITSPNQLAEFAASGKPVSLVVVDVNTGRGARVELDPRGKPADKKSADSKTAETAPAEQPQPPPVSLGLSAEPVKLGMRSALKVIRVDPAGPAAKAGIEPDDILVAANGAPTTGVEQLLSALRKSGPTLKLTVRDSRTGRDVDVDVNLGTIAKSAPAEVETPIKPTAGKLGAITELAFHDSDFAVKVTEVEPGSAAARAGLRPGLLIVAADGKPVLHPNDLNDAVRNSSGALKLTVVEPSSGKKSDLNLSLR
jgi:S1-C subfamily serine protease